MRGKIGSRRRWDISGPPRPRSQSRGILSASGDVCQWMCGVGTSRRTTEPAGGTELLTLTCLSLLTRMKSWVSPSNYSPSLTECEELSVHTHIENPRVSSSEEEAGQQMVNISLFSTGPDALYSFPATEMRDHQDLYPRCQPH